MNKENYYVYEKNYSYILGNDGELRIKKGDYIKLISNFDNTEDNYQILLGKLEKTYEHSFFRPRELVEIDKETATELLTCCSEAVIEKIPKFSSSPSFLLRNKVFKQAKSNVVELYNFLLDKPLCHNIDNLTEKLKEVCECLARLDSYTFEVKIEYKHTNMLENISHIIEQIKSFTYIENKNNENFHEYIKNIESCVMQSLFSSLQWLDLEVKGNDVCFSMARLEVKETLSTLQLASYIHDGKLYSAYKVLKGLSPEIKNELDKGLVELLTKQYTPNELEQFEKRYSIYNQLDEDLTNKNMTISKKKI